MPAFSFISCDWGTSHLRLRAVRDGDVSAAPVVQTADGVAVVAARPDGRSRPEQFQLALTTALERLDSTTAHWPIVISGMAASSVGWQELDYAPLPFPLDGAGMVCRELPTLAEHRIFLVSGVRAELDMMRGEETQLIGLAQAHELPVSAVIILPGTHSKHVRVRQRCVVDFRTFMTGELFAVLRRQSLLRHSTTTDGPVTVSAAFREGVGAGARRGLPATLFAVRARQVLRGDAAGQNTEYLSGLLIGAELAAIRSDEPCVLCAAPGLSELYTAALTELNVAHRLTVVPPPFVDELAARGQAVILRRLGLT